MKSKNQKESATVTCVFQQDVLPKKNTKQGAPTKVRCNFFDCQEEAVVNGQCFWHNRYEHYEIK